MKRSAMVGLLAGMLFVLGGGVSVAAALSPQAALVSTLNSALPRVNVTNPPRMSNPSFNCSARIKVRESPRPSHRRCRETTASASGGGWRVSKSYPAVPTGTLSVGCPSATTCYAVGGNSSGASVILATTNAGATWTSQSVPPAPGYLNGVACPSATTCYAVGYNSYADASVILATTNAGSTWTPQSVPSGAAYGYLSGVACPSATTCYAVGYNFSAGVGGVILATTNAGATWTSQSV
ncbi:MAG: WD40/YVTN/BNR-like repeat-containing protein, partial [Acidimicrobiales bacterium]